MPHVGCLALSVSDSQTGMKVPVHVLHPTQSLPRTEHFGSYALELAMHAPVLGDRLRVVAISHGTGGTPWVYRDLAGALARAGFAVVMIEHPGNNRSDNTLAGTETNLVFRPRHLRLAVDAVFADARLRPHLVPDGYAVIGHSLGGYTALALAGGRATASPGDHSEGTLLPSAKDPRVRAAVLLAPALPWFLAPEALAEVRVPLLVRTAEHDEHTPAALVEHVLRGLPSDARLDVRVVSGAGHFAFLTPFPPALTSPSFPPSQDPPGFDRPAYAQQLATEVVAFLREG